MAHTGNRGRGACRLLAVLLCLPALGMNPPDALGDASPPHMSVAEIVPGMRAIARTVFFGTEVDSFELEIIGILTNFSPGGDLILARAEGDSIRRTGIVQGMSGSPAYIDGRLIGALAYGWEFSREPLVGITPIEEMLELWEKEELPDRMSPGGLPRIQSTASEQEPRPLWTPIMVSGLTGAAAEILRDAMAPHRLAVIRSGGGVLPSRHEDTADIPVIPGSTVAVMLAGGDASIAAVGTITAREGDRVLGLGHPFLFMGAVDLPLNTTYVHGTIPLETRSFKLASPVKTVGLVTGDRRAGISGRIGEKPDLIPLTVSVTDRKQEERRYQYELVREPFLTPTLASVLALNSVLASGALQEESGLTVSLRARLAGEKNLSWHDRMIAQLPPVTIAERVMRPLELIMENPFASPQVTGVEVSVELQSETVRGYLDHVQLRQNVAAPGDTLQVDIRIRPYREEVQARTVRFPLPKTLPEGTFTLRVCDADSSTLWDVGRAPASYVPRSLDRLVELLGEQRTHDALYLQLVSPEPGRVVRGRELAGLPPSILSAMRVPARSPELTATTQRVWKELEFATDFPVLGCYELAVEVTRHVPLR